MEKNKKIEQEIRRTLDQFDHPEQLLPNSYFYTRVQARLDERRRQRNVFQAILRPAFITALVVINLSTAVWYLIGGDQQDTTESREQLIYILADDLELDTDRSNLLFSQ